MSPLRRILILLGLLAFAGGIGFAIYWVFFRPAPPAAPPAPPAVNVPVVGLPPAAPGVPRVPGAPAAEALPAASPVARGGLTQAESVAPTIVRAASLGADGKSVNYYDPTTGRFYRLDEFGEAIPLSDKTFPNVERATWSPAQSKAILEFPDGSNVLFDFETQRQATIPKHWEDFSFSPDGNKITGKSIGLDPNNRWLITSNPDGSGAVPIEPMGENGDKVTPTWSPSNQIIAFSKTGNPAGFGREEILLIGQHGENFKSLTVEGLGFQGNWAADGARLLYSAHSAETGYRPELWVVDAAGDRIGANRRRLNIQTWADKCTAASNSIFYCAVPRTLPEGVGFARDAADDVPDLIYSIDINTGRQTLVAEPDSRTSISSVMVSSDGKSLYFTEKTTGILRKIALQ